MVHTTQRHLPAEWAPQSGVMLTWPHPYGDWHPWLTEVEPVFVAIAREVARRENLLITCYDAAHRAHVARLLQDAGVDLTRAILESHASNDTWARDHGPITVLDDERPRLLDFTFNGWGGKYPADLDNTLTRHLHAQGVFHATPLETLDMVLEGGSLDSDGQGTVLTTTRCLLSPARNPRLDRTAIETRLADDLGASRVLWLEHGYLAGDDTDSHVDTLARFCDEHTIAYVACPEPGDEHYAELNAMAAELRSFTDAGGEPYRLVALPWPEPKYARDGQRLPATYANFLIINDAVLVPTYRDPADAEALRILGECFPGREAIGIDCRPLIEQFGSLHCVTMQLPAGVL